jgi:hypothetical protein
LKVHTNKDKYKGKDEDRDEGEGVDVDMGEDKVLAYFALFQMILTISSSFLRICGCSCRPNVGTDAS